MQFLLRNLAKKIINFQTGISSCSLIIYIEFPLKNAAVGPMSTILEEK